MGRTRGRHKPSGNEKQPPPCKDGSFHARSSAGIVIWDPQGCKTQTDSSTQRPSILQLLQSVFPGSNLVTVAASADLTQTQKEQLQTLSYCNVEVLTPGESASTPYSQCMQSKAKGMLKQVKLAMLVLEARTPTSQMPWISISCQPQ